MVKKNIILLSVVFAIVLLLSAQSYARPANLSTIVSPTRLSTVDSPVEIVVRFRDGANPNSFKARLNGNDITDKFTATEDGVSALVTSEDGLRIRNEKEGSRRPKINVFKTVIRGSRRKRDVDIRVFFVRAGEAPNIQPVAQASASVYTGTAPLEVEFSGTGTDSDGDIVLYEWDFDGDGVYDWSSDQDGQASYTYNLPGEYNAVFRVTDNDGLVSDPVNINISVDEQMVIVPELVGLTYTEAENAIISAGLIVGNITFETSDTVPEDYVLSQNPTGSTSVSPGSSVDLVLSLGSEPPPE